MKIPALLSFFLAALFLFCGCNPRIEHGWEFVVSVGTNQVSRVSSNEMQRVVRTLARRVDLAGCRASVEQVGDDRISIKLDPDSKAQIDFARRLLSRGGVLQFRLVHQDNAKLLETGIVPVGYRLLKEQRAGPGGTMTTVPHIVSREVIAGLGGTNVSRAGLGRDAMNRPEIMLSFDREGAAAFERVTSQNVGRALAILLDGEIYSAPIIRSAIAGGHASISGSFTIEEASQIAAVLQYPLEVPLVILEDRKF